MNITNVLFICYSTFSFLHEWNLFVLKLKHIQEKREDMSISKENLSQCQDFLISSRVLQAKQVFSTLKVHPFNEIHVRSQIFFLFSPL